MLAPQLLKALREAALVQSVQSSNRIEGVTVAAARLRPLVVGQARPQDRPEEEIQGYCQALNLIHASARELLITPEILKRLHSIAQRGAGDAVDELCLSYRHALSQESAPPLVAVVALVLDFLCIHPFRDGNGRVARLLTLLALYHHGYEVGRYISLERLVEEWLNYFLGVVRRAYREFEESAGQIKTPRGAKTALVEAAIGAFPGDFTLADLERACPGVSRDMVRRVLRKLQKAGKVACLGRGPGAAWRRKGNIGATGIRPAAPGPRTRTTPP